MSTYEWVIEQESADGVTTRIVFDFADGDADDSKGIDNTHANGSRYNSSSSHHRLRGGARGGRGGSSAYGQSFTPHQQQQQQQLQMGMGTAASGPFFSYKDTTATRSEGGSSKRSSKRSTGSRSRRQHHHGSSSASGSGATVVANGSMLASAGSAYTSAALRQRYHRMLFGDRSSSSSVMPSTSSRLEPASNNTVNSVNFYTRSADPRTGGSYAASPPPSTLFMSTYGAELVEEEEPSSGSYPPRRSRASTNSTSSSNGGIHTSATTNTHGGGAGVAASTVISEFSDAVTTSDPFYNLEVGAEEPRMHTRPSLHESETSAHDYVDDEERLCHYVKRDVWAARATCPRTVTATACDFPAFPPLHPISVEEVVGEREAKAHRGTREARARRGSDEADSLVLPPRGPVAAQQLFRVVACSRGGGQMGFASAPFAGAAPPLDDEADATADSRRYNKMLLRKERQRGRGRGWQATSTAAAAVSSAGESGEGRVAAGRGRGAANRTVSRQSEQSGSRVRRHPGERSTGHRGRQSNPFRHDGVVGGGGGGGRENDDDDASSRSFDSNDADAEADSDDSSLECLSNTSSSESSDAEALRADLSFSAKVQSLAHRAGRERRKMEAREERQLQNELMRCEEALLTPPMAPRPDSPPSPTSPPFSMAAALRQRDASFTLTGQKGTQRSARNCESSSRGSDTATTPSSFFISPIHQSVAAESASWTAGTRFQFLGQGGMGGGSGNGRVGTSSSSSASTSTAAPGLPLHTAGASRRRGRADDDAEEVRYAAEEMDEAPLVALADLPAPSAAAGTSLSKSQARRARKQRKKGDQTHQSVVPECGGSRALRPVAPPSIAPPLELLPCSKKAMCEDMLESFLMAAVLEEDDFKLL